MDKVEAPVKTPLNAVQKPDQAWKKLAVNILGPIEAKTILRYAITIMDYYSKWPEVLLTDKVTTRCIIHCLDLIASREGYPRELVTDNRDVFVNRDFEVCLKARNIKHCRSSLYFPGANGEIERFNRSFEQAMISSHKEGKDMAQYCRKFLMDYRSRNQAGTGTSPSLLLHGRSMRTKLNVFDNVQGISLLRDRVRDYHQKYNERGNTKRKKVFNYFKPGTYVKLCLPSSKGELDNEYVGPFRIESRFRRYLYRLEDGRVFNGSELVKAYVPSGIRLEERASSLAQRSPRQSSRQHNQAS